MFYTVKDSKVYEYADHKFCDNCKETDLCNMEEYSRNPEVYPVINGVIILDEYKKGKVEKERINQLSMTPLDFINALDSEFGIKYSVIKELCDTNENVDKQLRFCNRVYRFNKLLNTFCGQFGVTAEQLDALFEKYGE